MMKALVTGFAGSLGTEFCRYLRRHGYEVEGVDSNEWAVAAFPDMPRLTKRLADVSSCAGQYDLVVHCAAYKHVDLIESNKVAAYENNVERTLGLLSATRGSGKFLFVSTDKAVNPSSYYGMTKRRGEEAVRLAGGYVARLGNIYASNGSVIPTWEAAAERGDPLPVTDLSMTRYFISAGNAVRSIMELLEHAEPGDTVVPEMGEPRLLSEILSQFRKRSGLPDDYPTRDIGRRPGEKLHEQLVWPEERTVYQDDNGIIVRL